MNTTTITPIIPPKSPDNNNYMDVEETTPHTYKKMLRDKSEIYQTEYYEEDDTTIIKDDKGKYFEGSIALFQEDKNCIYFPWRFFVIINVFGRRMPHQYLRSKLIDL